MYSVVVAATKLKLAPAADYGSCSAVQNFSYSMTLQISYENVKFAASDVIRETLFWRLSLAEYFELKITDNQSNDFLRMLSKNDLPFS